jgi:hypothetical protein
MVSLWIPVIKNGIKISFSSQYFQFYILDNVYLSREPYNILRTRYFSESRQGHTPLHGRAYYQMMECLGVSLQLFFSLYADTSVVFLILTS